MQELGMAEFTAICDDPSFISSEALRWLVVPMFMSFSYSAYLWIGAERTFDVEGLEK